VITFNLNNLLLSLRWPLVEVLPLLGDISQNIPVLRQQLLERVRTMGRKFTRAESIYLPQALPTPIGPLTYGGVFPYMCQNCVFFLRDKNQCEVVGGFNAEEDGFINDTAWCALWTPDPAQPTSREPGAWVSLELEETVRGIRGTFSV